MKKPRNRGYNMWRLIYRKWIFTGIFTFIILIPPYVFGSGSRPILVGATVSLEGKYKETSYMIQNGFRVWAKEVNRHGGLLGRAVKLIFYDDRSRKDLVRKLYEKLIMEDKVNLLFSPYSTSLTLVASEVSERLSRPSTNPERG